MPTIGRTLFPVVACLPILSACHERQAVSPPPRAADPVPVPRQSSVLTVPIEGEAEIIRRAIETAIPQLLWSIDEPATQCIPPQRVKLLGKRIKITPKITCAIHGTVSRHAIRLRGEGQDIVADMPISARITARDVRGLLKGETATGVAMAHARIRLMLTSDWRLTGRIKLSYDWTTPPGIDFLGQRIRFAEKADEKLQPIVRQLKRDLPRHLSQVHLRTKVEHLWRQGFATLELNERNPAVWMRLTPQKLLYGGYVLQENKLRLDLGLAALTETFVGPRPADPTPTPLLPPAHTHVDGSFALMIPVTADYAELEPVILRALRKRAARPFDLPKLGPIIARFDKLVAYGTTGNRIAVGVTLAARPASGKVGDTHGTVWLTARPVNQPNSALVHFEDLQVTGTSDGIGGDILIALAGSPAFSAAIAGALSQNFTHDLEDLKGKIRRAIGERKTPHFRIRTNLDSTEIGQISAHGQGLYLPVRATGRASIRYAGGPL
ncbi:DUF4403 family protein [Sphingobium yanoikuyae]|uniref:DUF4403 family protein n=1 Tax=Sphingobium yanoikuyae TaxID=13690 RepID=UPI000262C33A|nr:DUF4403 family protein [Sphingobium yanoikuyae]